MTRRSIRTKLWMPLSRFPSLTISTLPLWLLLFVSLNVVLVTDLLPSGSLPRSSVAWLILQSARTSPRICQSLSLGWIWRSLIQCPRPVPPDPRPLGRLLKSLERMLFPISFPTLCLRSSPTLARVIDSDLLKLFQRFLQAWARPDSKRPCQPSCRMFLVPSHLFVKAS